MSEETYDKLRSEWQDKILNLRLQIENMEFDTSKYLDDLEIALALLSNISRLFERLEEKQKNELLQILAKRIIINLEGEIISHKLHSPFSYLVTLVEALSTSNEEGYRSEYIHDGVPNMITSEQHSIAVEQFLEMLRFENRRELSELPGDLLGGSSDDFIIRSNN